MDHSASKTLAALVVSAILAENGIEHALIGGTALNPLGSTRATEDVDLKVTVEQAGLREGVTKLLLESDARFSLLHNRLLFCPGDGDLADRALIEMLATGMLGLPSRLVVIKLEQSIVPILAPGLLVLTKIKRCVHCIGSTGPKSIKKLNSDLHDILFLLRWLGQRGQTIDLDEYETALVDKLYGGVKLLKTHWEEKGRLNTSNLSTKSLRMRIVR